MTIERTMTEQKQSEVEREVAMSREQLKEHLTEIGKMIIRDADSIALPSIRVRSIKITADIEPGEQATTVNYSITRFADPRCPEREDEG